MTKKEATETVARDLASELRDELLELRTESREQWAREKNPFDLGVAMGLSAGLDVLMRLTQATENRSSPNSSSGSS